MLKIRLQRTGRKNVPTFRIVLTDSRNSTKSGKYKEILGSYDPVNKTKAFKADRIKHWLSKGAQATDTMHNFLISEKVITGKKLNVLPLKKPIKPASTEASGKEEAVAEAAPAVAPAAPAATQEKPAEPTPAAEQVAA